LFPNPSQGQAPQLAFSQALSQPAVAQVLRINGSEVLKQGIQSGVQYTAIASSTLQPGVYLCIITLDDGSRLPARRFVVVE
jgi:hypothetical protein